MIQPRHIWLSSVGFQSSVSISLKGVVPRIAKYLIRSTLSLIGLSSEEVLLNDDGSRAGEEDDISSLALGKGVSVGPKNLTYSL